MAFPALSHSYSPNAFTGHDDHALFEYCVKCAAIQRMDLSPHTHQQWANIFFSGDSSENRIQKMSRVKHAYGIYFTSGLQYTFNVELIVQHFPYWFDGHYGVPDAASPSVGLLFDDINLAIEQEMEQALDKRNIESYRVLGWDEHPYENRFVYSASIYVSEDEDPHFREGTKIRVKDRFYTHTCEVVEYDYVEGVLHFTSERE